MLCNRCKFGLALIKEMKKDLNGEFEVEQAFCNNGKMIVRNISNCNGWARVAVKGKKLVSKR